MATTNPVTIKDVVSFIYQPSLSAQDREAIIRALNEQRKLSAMRASADLYPGCKVEFTHSRTGRTVKGTVTKINRMTVHVKEEGGQFLNWRCSPGVLRVVTA